MNDFKLQMQLNIYLGPQSTIGILASQEETAFKWDWAESIFLLLSLKRKADKQNFLQTERFPENFGKCIFYSRTSFKHYMWIEFQHWSSLQTGKRTRDLLMLVCLATPLFQYYFRNTLDSSIFPVKIWS